MRNNNSEWKETLSKIFDIIGEILAVLLVLVFLFFYLNSAFGGFMDKVPVLMKILTAVKEYGALLLVGIVGLEAMVKRNIVLFIIFLAVLACVVMFMFFPDTIEMMFQLKG